MSIEKFERPERPAYRVLDQSGFFGDDDTLHELGAEIYFDGEPAIEMEPLNEPARIKMIELLDRLESAGRAAAEKLGRPFSGRPRSLEGGLALASALQRQEMSVMGAEKHSDITPVIHSETPEMVKRGRGRPKKVA